MMTMTATMMTHCATVAMMTRLTEAMLTTMIGDADENGDYYADDYHRTQMHSYDFNISVM